VYDAAGHLLGQASDPSAWSDNVTAVVPGVVPGQRYFFVVTGATHDVFDAGAYAINVSLPGSSPQGQPTAPGSSPPAPISSPPPPAPVTPPVILPDRFEPNDTRATATWLGRVTQTTVSGLTFNSGYDVDFFMVRTGWTGAYRVTAPGTVIQVLNSRGKLITTGVNQVTLPSYRAGTYLYVRTSPAGGAAMANYSVTVGLVLHRLPARKLARPHRQVVASPPARPRPPRLLPGDGLAISVHPRPLAVWLTGVRADWNRSGAPFGEI
jgi:hypothetical protein